MASKRSLVVVVAGPNEAGKSTAAPRRALSVAEFVNADMIAQELSAFRAGLRNLLSLYDGAVDSWEVLDNSDVTGPCLLARRRARLEMEALDPPAWRRLLEERR